MQAIIKNFLFYSSLTLSQSWTAYGFANPLSCSGTCTNAHDPSLIQRDSDGTYFRFSTGGKIAIHSAPSAQGPWTYKGAAIPACSSIQLAGNCDLWAPDVNKVGDTYYLYYSVSSFGSQNSAIGVATSTTLDSGSWTDHGSTGVRSDSSKNYNAIDGNLVAVGDKHYLNFGSFWADLFQIEMSNPPNKVASGATRTQLAFNGTGSQALEGAYMFQQGNFYYLFFSSGKCCGFDTSRPAPGEEYKIMVCRSESATGGFVDQDSTPCTESGGTLVLGTHGFVYGPGGQGVYDDTELGPILYYHYVDTRIGFADGQKQFGINKIDFSSGWPVV